MKKRLIISFGCILAVVLMIGAAKKVSTKEVSPGITISTVVSDWKDKNRPNTQTELTRKNGSKVALVIKTVTSEGHTNITSAFLVDNAILLTTMDEDGDGNPEKFFLEHPKSHKVEAFGKSPEGFNPLSVEEIEKFKAESRQFR